jgi:hypothetical protein
VHQSGVVSPLALKGAVTLSSVAEQTGRGADGMASVPASDLICIPWVPPQPAAQLSYPKDLKAELGLEVEVEM